VMLGNKANNVVCRDIKKLVSVYIKAFLQAWNKIPGILCFDQCECWYCFSL